MDISTSDVPKAYTRHVLRAIAFLQRGESIFINEDNIVRQVMLQMRRGRKLDVVKGHVLKSLSSLTRLGILSRNPSSEYNFYPSPVERSLFPARIRCTKRSRFVAGRIPQKTNRTFVNHGCKSRIGKTARKMTLPRPRRQFPFKAKYKTKRSYAYSLPNHVVCTCCRSHVIPYVETFSKLQSGYLEAMADKDSNDAKVSTVTAEQCDVLANEIEDPPTVEQTPKDSTVSKRYSFHSPIPIVKSTK